MTFSNLINSIKEIISNESYLFADHIDVEYLLSENMDSQDFIEAIERSINENEVIYYSTAMNFLMENDNSLNESMQIAAELCYEPQNINSELLATLLLQSKLKNCLYNVTDEIETAFEEYEEYLEDQENN